MKVFDILEEAERYAAATERLLNELQSSQTGFSDELSGRVRRLLDMHSRNKERITTITISIVTTLVQLATLVESKRPKNPHHEVSEYLLKMTPETEGYGRLSIGQDGKLYVRPHGTKKTHKFDSVENMIGSFAVTFDCLGFCRDIVERLRIVMQTQAEEGETLQRHMTECVQAMSAIHASPPTQPLGPPPESPLASPLQTS